MILNIVPINELQARVLRVTMVTPQALQERGGAGVLLHFISQFKVHVRVCDLKAHAL